MAWRYHNFECKCGREFECLVDNADFIPSPCPSCGAENATMLAVGRVNTITSYVPDYPGANQHRAGFAELRRPPEKKGRQISMVDAKKKPLNARNVPSAKGKSRAAS